MAKNKRKAEDEAGPGASQRPSSRAIKTKLHDHDTVVVTFPSGYTPGTAKEHVQTFESGHGAATDSDGDGTGDDRQTSTSVVVATDKRVDFVGATGTRHAGGYVSVVDE